jgi:hypothetical protein
MKVRQCSSCVGICKKSGCERANVYPIETPAWHDAPNAPGLWAVETVQVVDKSQIKRIETLTDRRWFGPISPDTEKL